MRIRKWLAVILALAVMGSCLPALSETAGDSRVTDYLKQVAETQKDPWVLAILQAGASNIRWEGNTAVFQMRSYVFSLHFGVTVTDRDHLLLGFPDALLGHVYKVIQGISSLSYFIMYDYHSAVICFKYGLDRKYISYDRLGSRDAAAFFQVFEVSDGEDMIHPEFVILIVFCSFLDRASGWKDSEFFQQGNRHGPE